jgi:hypothetical protein
MAKLKRSSPALYELIQGRSAPRSAHTPVEPTYEPQATGPGVSETLSAWLGAGRVLRLPIGYIFIGIAVSILLLILVYALAYRHGYETASAEAAAAFDSRGLARPGGPEDDPLNRAAEVIDLPKRGATGAPAASDTRPAGPAASPAWGPVFSEPRARGLSYFVLATTNRDGGKRLADFCRRNGLEAYVVPDNDKRFHLVIALPGFDPKLRSSADVKALEARIHQIGDRWKQTERGATNLRDAYPLPPYHP